MLWSIARYDLGLTSEEFFKLTPRQFHALTTRHKDANERAELLMGISTAVLANHSFNTPKTALRPIDIMPCKWAEREDPSTRAPKRFNRQKFADSLRSMMVSSGKLAKVAPPVEPTRE